MSERYAVKQLEAALAVDANTARGWLEDLGIEPTQDRYDGRRKWISSEDAQRVAEAHDRVLLAIPEDAPKTLASAMRIIARLQEENTQLRSQVRTLSATLGKQDRQEAASHVPQPPRPRDGHPRASAATHDPLPDGWVAARTFGNQHGIPKTTIENAINTGKLAAHSGYWKHGGSLIRHAFDPDQQAACLAWRASRQTP